MKTPDQVLTIIKESIDEAISQFGTYSYFDKGPWEVLDYNKLLNEMKSLDKSDALKISLELNNHANGVGENLAEFLLEDLGYMDEN